MIWLQFETEADQVLPALPFETSCRLLAVGCCCDDDDDGQSVVTCALRKRQQQAFALEKALEATTQIYWRRRPH